MSEKDQSGKLAVFSLIGLAASYLVKCLVGMLIGGWGGSYAVASYAAAEFWIGIVSVIAIVCTLIALWRPNQVLTYVACGAECLFALLFLIVPGMFAGRRGSAPGDILAMTSAYLRTSGIVILLVGIACVVYSLYASSVGIKTYLKMMGAAAGAAFILTLIFCSAFRFGMTGAAFVNIIQPIAAILPLLLLNFENEKLKALVSKVTPRPALKKDKPSAFTYLDQYKQKKKGE